jgi:pyruvate/2-oxoacid:ferredoxin oxidoreductase beta subunit
MSATEVEKAGSGEPKLPKVFKYYTEKDQVAGGTTFCTGCPAELTLRAVPMVLGKDIIIVGTPGCAAPVLHGQGLGAWHKLAYYSCLMTGVPSSASGISRYFKKIGQDVTVVCFTGDGDATDIGFQALSGAAERQENIIYICYDNEGYMNTGNQRSSQTPRGAMTSTTPVGVGSPGKRSAAKNMPVIMAMHPTSYVATATLSHMDDYCKKLAKAKEKRKEGLAYLHVFSPCPVGWRMENDSSIAACRAAVRTNYFPLWEAEHGKFRFTQKVTNPKPIKEYMDLTGKYSHMTEEGIAEFQQMVNERYDLIRSLCEGSGTKQTQ